MRNPIVLLLLAGTLALGADSASDLLQKAIYTQDTVGDTEAAIKIYRQIVGESKAGRAVASQAQYRLGMVLLKKGNAAEARTELQRLIDEYPEQKELAEKARQVMPLDLKLLPEPWADGETMQLSLKLAGGASIGAIILTADLVDYKNAKAWQLGIRRADVQSRGGSRVLADVATFRPLTSRFKHSMLGTVEDEYSSGVARVVRAGAEPKDVEMPSVVFDNEQGMHLFRRLPLAEGYKATIPFFASFGSGRLDVAAEVTKRETVETPLGKFDTFKLELTALHQTFWIANDSTRTLAKFEASGVMAEVTSVRQSRGTQELRSVKLGVSAILPAGWFSCETDLGGSVVHLLDPDADAMTMIVAENESSHSAEELRKAMEDKLALRSKALQGYSIRAESWQRRDVAGMPAWTAQGDYKENGKDMMESATAIQAPAKRFILMSRGPVQAVEALRPQLDAILSSIQTQ